MNVEVAMGLVKSNFRYEFRWNSQAESPCRYEQQAVGLWCSRPAAG